jgi:hypothetical protein
MNVNIVWNMISSVAVWTIVFEFVERRFDLVNVRTHFAHKTLRFTKPYCFFEVITSLNFAS